MAASRRADQAGQADMAVAVAPHQLRAGAGATSEPSRASRARRATRTARGTSPRTRSPSRRTTSSSRRARSATTASRSHPGQARRHLDERARLGRASRPRGRAGRTAIGECSVRVVRATFSGLAICFDCELANRERHRAPRLMRRYRWDRPVKDPARLAVILGALCPRSRRTSSRGSRKGGERDPLADVTAAQDEQLAALLPGVAPNVVAWSTPPAALVFASPPSGACARLAATVVVGGLAIGLGVPLVPFAAFVTSALLIGRMPRFIARRLTLGRAEIDALLGPLAEGRCQRARARRGLA